MSENFNFSILISQVKIEFDSQKLQNRFMTNFGAEIDTPK